MEPIQAGTKWLAVLLLTVTTMEKLVEMASTIAMVVMLATKAVLPMVSAVVAVKASPRFDS